MNPPLLSVIRAENLRPFAIAQGDKGSYLSLFHTNDVPILGRVILGINYQVDDSELGINRFRSSKSTFRTSSRYR